MLGDRLESSRRRTATDHHHHRGSLPAPCTASHAGNKVLSPPLHQSSHFGALRACCSSTTRRNSSWEAPLPASPSSTYPLSKPRASTWRRVFCSPSLTHIYCCCKDLTPYQVRHGVWGEWDSRTHRFCWDLVHAQDHWRLYTAAYWQ